MIFARGCRLVGPVCGTLLALTSALLPAEPPQNVAVWPRFRGPDAAGSLAPPLDASQDGRARPDAQFPPRWTASENVVWKTPVPGKGWSSPVCTRDRVFLTSVVSDEPAPPLRKGFYLQGANGVRQEGEHRWLVVALDLASGRELWRREAHRGPAPSALHVKNSLASETPVTDGRRVYAMFGNVGLFCYHLDGRPAWSQRWPVVETRNGLGTGGSPVVHDGRVFVVHDNETRSFLTALDADTGREMWRVERPEERTNWTTPLVWKNDVRTELVTVGSGAVRSYDLDGRLLWQMRGMSKTAIPSPVASGGLLFVASGQPLDSLRPLVAIRPGASGDISLNGEESSNAFVAWSRPLAGPYHPTPIVVGERLYVLYDRGFLAVYDRRTGAELTAKRRIGETAFTASPWTDGRRLYCLNEDGATVVLELPSGAADGFRVAGVNRLNDTCLATPAIVGERLLIRGLSHLYCIGPGDRPAVETARRPERP